MNHDRLLVKALKSAMLNTKVELSSAPLLRDWIHHYDISTAVVCALENIESISKYQSVNICSGVQTGCREMLKMLEKISGRSIISEQVLEIEDNMGALLPGVLPRPCELPGWSQTFTLNDGLRDMWKWANSQEGLN